ncbi:uncharacterized protein [Coffea arabica]|uniref:Retrovirus-related Pol polyprotein from transposon TNT 1-94-like beta-barrel domain-containing protein n=1 Tax=Coffea arabica TaxID=13443 RepID=A0ABM4U616_COFAR
MDNFDGTNFTRWKDKLLFLLMELGVAYLLVDNLPKIPEPSVGKSDEIKTSRKKHEEDEVRCRAFILNILSDRLYDMFHSLKSLQEIWKVLENKYMSEKQVSDQLQVGAAIAKLPSTGNDYRKKLLHTPETFTIDQLTKHIQIEEETCIRENKFALESGTKVKNIESRANKKSGKVETSLKGHFKKECKFYKKLKTEINARQKKANVVEDSLPNNAEIVTMVGGFSINVEIECNLINSQSNDWWYGSGDTVHVGNDKNLFKNYQVVALNEIVLMENHNTSDVLGKGTVELEFTSGKTLVLINVYHVPDTKKNLISASVLCNKGLKAVIDTVKVASSTS